MFDFISTFKKQNETNKQKKNWQIPLTWLWFFVASHQQNLYKLCLYFLTVFIFFFFFLNLFLYFYMMQLYLAKYFIAPGAFKVNSTEKTLCLFHILFLFVFFPWRGNLPPFHVEQEHNLCSWSPNHFFYQLLI